MIKRLLVTIIATLALFLPLALPVAVTAEDVQNSLCSGANDLSISAASGNECDNLKDKGTGKANQLVTKIINIISIIVGIIAVIMIIYAGFRYITSAGNQENVKSAKTTLIYAIIGLIVVALAQIIVRFVLRETTTNTSSSSTTNSTSGSPTTKPPTTRGSGGNPP